MVKTSSIWLLSVCHYNNNYTLKQQISSVDDIIPENNKIFLKFVIARQSQIDSFSLSSLSGHVDAGKSTLMGHLLYNLGNVTKRAMHK